MKTVAVLVFLGFGGLASASLLPKFVKPRPRDPSECIGTDLNEVLTQFTTELFPFELFKELTLGWFETDPQMMLLHAWISSDEVRTRFYDALHAYGPFLVSKI